MKLHGTRTYVDPTPVPKMPAGLVELMEGLSREVLKKNPSEVYEFCAQHMRNLMVLRDGKPPEKYLTLEEKIVKANNIIKHRADERRRKFDNDIQLHEKQENIEQSLDDDMIACDVMKTDNQTKSKDLELREENENILEQEIKSEDVATGEYVNDNESEDASKNHLDDSHIIEKGKDTGDKKCFKSLDQIDISEKEEHIDIEQAFTEDRNDSTIYPKIKEYDNDSKRVQEIDITTENIIYPDLDCNNIDQVNVKGCTTSTDNITLEGHNEGKQRIDEKEEVQCIIFGTHEQNQSNYNNGDKNIEENILTARNLKDTESNIEIDNAENKDIKAQEKAIGIDLENSSEDNEKHDNMNDIKTNIIDTKQELEVNANVLDQNNEMNKETEDTSHRTPNETKDTEIDKEESQKNNLNHREENQITPNISFDNAVTENENEKQGLEAKDVLLSQSKIIDNVLDNDSSNYSEKVILLNEQQNHKINDCATNLTAQNDDNTHESSDMNNFNKDLDNSDPLLVTITSEQHDQDSEIDSNTIHDNSQLLLKKYEDKPKNSENPEKVRTLKEDDENNEQQDASKKGGQSNIFDTHDQNELNYNNSDQNIEELENKETTDFKSPKTMDLETAAITIQKVFRNFLFRSKTSSLEEATNINFNVFERETDTKDESDFKAHNHNKDRRVMGISRIDSVLQTVNEEKSLSLSTDDSSTISSAATVIQAHIRGFLCRNRLNRNKAQSSASFNESNDSSLVSSEVDPDLVKNKTVLNIHIVPEGGEFVSRDESLLTSMELSLDGSPPTSAKLHPLGYDKSERRKQLKREDAIQSISPPSNNSRLSEEQDSVKEVLINEVQIDEAGQNHSKMPFDSEIKTAISNDGIISTNSLEEKPSSNENLKDTNRLCEDQALIKEVLIRNDEIEVENNISVMVAADSKITTGTTNDNVPKNGLEEEIRPAAEISKDNSKQVNQNVEAIKEVLINEDKTEIEENSSINIPDDSQTNIPTSNDNIPKTGGENLKAENNQIKEQESVKKVLNGEKEIQPKIGSELTVDSQINVANPNDDTQKNNLEYKAVTEMSSDEFDVVTPFTPTEEKLNDSEKPKLLHSGEFHDVVLPTKVSRNDTSVVSDFHNVLVYFLVWNN